MTDIRSIANNAAQQAADADDVTMAYIQKALASVQAREKLIAMLEQAIEQKSQEQAIRLVNVSHNAAVVTGGAIGKLDGSQVDTTVTHLSDISTQYIKAMYQPNPYKGICYVIWGFIAFSLVLTIVVSLPESQPQSVEVRQ